MFPPLLQSVDTLPLTCSGAPKVTVSGSFSFDAGGFKVFGQGVITFEMTSTALPVIPA